MAILRDEVSKRGWDKLIYHDPEFVLRKQRELQILVAQSGLDTKVKNLRTQKLKKHLEGRQAALFCHGLKNVVGEKVHFTLEEAQDYDIVTIFAKDGEQIYTPVQLKEIVPKTLNQKADFNSLIQSLAKKYVVSKELVVAVHWNQAGQFNVSELSIPKLNISELWVYGSGTPNQSKWFLIGNLLETPKYYEFDYPT